MSDERASPKITGISWGRVEVEGHGTFKDVKLYPGGAGELDWNETGTRHSPGIQPADIRGLLDHGAQTIVLGTGFHQHLKVQPETLQMLKDVGVAVYVRHSEEAARVLTELKNAGALLHSTC